MYKYLEVANVLGLLGCKLSDSAYWMGFLCDFLILPSIVAMGAGIIGCNLASLVNKQGLNLYKT